VTLNPDQGHWKSEGQNRFFANTNNSVLSLRVTTKIKMYLI